MTIVDGKIGHEEYKYLVKTTSEWCCIYTNVELHYNEEKADKGDIDESDIIDDRYFSAARCYIPFNLVYDRGSSRRFWGMAAWKQYWVCKDRQGSSL